MNNFEEYLKNYDMSDPDINYKYYHSYRVMNNMILLSKCMNLPYKDIELAKFIGLYHDIGRFEQDKLFNSFKDTYMDHGDYGVTVIKENKFLKEHNIDEEDYEVVYKAIKNHNKFKIEDNLNKRELLFTKLIRDADKLDILYALSNEKIKPIIYEDNKEISIEIKNTFYENKSTLKKYVKSKSDNIIVLFSFIYDINFNITLILINDNKYYDKIYQRLKNKELFKPYYEYLNKYIKERID